MARIAGVDLEDQLKLDYALTKITGVGWSLSEKILDTLKINPRKRVKDLTKNEIVAISSELEKHPTEGDISRTVRGNIQRLKVIGSYRGLRHRQGLPARGQRTRSNARTKRGKRRTVGAFKKEQLAKMQQPTKTKEK